MRGYLLVGCASLAISACGGGDKPVKKPKPKKEVVEKPKPETEQDRAKKRHEQALELIPEGTSCLPVALKEADAPRLEIAAVGADAITCALDNDKDRLLGPIACWKINLATGELAYKDPEPLPGFGFAVRMHKHCAWDYCLPDDAKEGDAEIAHIAWGSDGKKVAVLVGDDVHLFDAESKEHDSSFSIRGDKGVTNKPSGLHMLGGTIIVEGSDDGPFSAVWVFKGDGTPVGPVMTLGGKKEEPVSTYKGSLSLLDKDRIGVSEKGMATLTTYEVETGKRAKLVRKVGRPSCKTAEIDAFWRDGDKVSDKCRASMTKLSGHLIGATAVAGAKNFLVLLRGARLGELGVLDAKSLAEKKTIPMKWCPADQGDKGKSKGDDDDDDADKDEDEGGGSKKRGPETKRSGDPEEGGE